MIAGMVKDAINKDYNLVNQQLEIRKTEQDITEVRETYLPKVSAIAAYAYLDSKLSSDLSALTLPGLNISLPEGAQTFRNTNNIALAALNAQMVLFSGMQVTYGSKAIGQKRQAMQLLVEARQLDIAEDVITTADQIAVLQQSKVLLDESKLRLDKELQRVNSAVKNGLSIPYERKRIEVALNQLASKQAEYEGNKTVLYSKLEMLTGRSQAELEKIAVRLNPWLLSKHSAGDVKSRFEVRALESAEHATDYQIKMQKAKILPQIIGMASYSDVKLFNNAIRTPFANPINGQDIVLKPGNLKLYPTWMAGIGLKWDLFTGLSRTRGLNKLLIDKAIALNREKEVTEKLDLQLKKSLSDYELAMKQVDLKTAEKSLAESTLKLAIKSYEQGLLSVSERLAAETGMQEAQLEYLQSIFNQRKAAIQYLKAGGKFSLDQL